MALPAAAAFGQTAIHHDTVHDVIRTNLKGESHVAVPRNKTADILRVRFTHTNRRAVTTMRLRAYGGRWLYNGLIKTPTKRFVVVGWGQHARKHFELWKGTKHPIDVPCDGMASKVDRAKHTFRVSVPAICLSSPRWVRMGQRYFVHAHDNAYVADDALGPDFRNLFRMLTARLYTN